MNALLNPTVRQIVAQVDAVLRHDPTASVVGIRAMANESWPARVTVRDREFSLAWCPSPIAAREQLVALEDEIQVRKQQGESDADRPSGLVMLTPLDDQSLGSDVLARLSRGRVFSVESWEMLRHAFQAREIDPRLARWPWVAEALLETLPTGGYPPVAGGFLDAQTAWAYVLRAVLGIAQDPGTRPDLPSLLRWSLSPEATQRYAALSDTARRQVGEWLTDSLAASGKLVVQVLDAGYGGVLAPLSLVCGMLFDAPEGGAMPAEALAASVRLERFTGGTPVSRSDGLRLYGAAQQLLGSLDPSMVAPVLDTADRLVESLHLTGCAHLSKDLPCGFNARLVRFADAITEFLASRSTEAANNVLATGRDVQAHRLSSTQYVRTRRVSMAMRLVRWMVEPDQARASAGIEAAVRNYLDDGAFADWARLSLLGGDELAVLSRAFSALREAVRERREAQNQIFGRVLAAWNAAGCPSLAGVVPVENIVADVVAPVAKATHVLLLVIDGLSYPIFRELMDDVARHGWVEVLPQDCPKSPCGLATIPSVTEISRTSLFAGKLQQGQAANEKTAFAQHPDLVALNPSNRLNARPVVYHKADLVSGADGVSLSDAVRDAISGRDRRVVAVVFNGVDDQLSGSEQLQPRWTLEDLRLIKPILHEARLGNRAVVITADHGHMMEEATRVVTLANSSSDVRAQGDRWRSQESVPSADGELLFKGGRVLTPNGDQEVVVPWSESLRYGSRKNGYHGGVTLQEMIVPVATFMASMDIPDAYQPASTVIPQWWEATVIPTQAQQAVPEVSPTRAVPKKIKSVIDERQAVLFDAPPTNEIAPAVTADWISALLTSSVFLAQKQWVARAGIKDEEVRALLEALSERGGKLSKSALAARLGLPAMRVSGFVNAARRLLNVDQAPVLTVDESEGSVSLNRSLLDAQFYENKP